MTKNKIRDKEALQATLKELQAAGKTVVQCHGCFDIIHPGHVRYLEHAKSMGDILVVSLTADKFILKGDDRPFMPQELRLKAMAALQIVDYVMLDENSWAGPVLELLQPDVYVKGKEYENVYSGPFGEERSIVENYGGQMFFTSGDVVFSSSKIISDFKEKFALEHEVFKVYCERNAITRQGMLDLLDSMQSKKVAVIGEVIMDEYIYSEVVDVSAEAPILTIRPVTEEHFVGAAGIVARHINALGGDAVLFSMVGQDDTANEIRKVLKNEGVEAHLLEKSDQATIRKVRYLGDDQKLLKIDHSQAINLSKDESASIIEDIKKSSPDLIVFSDFAYGFVSHDIRSQITAWANEQNIPVLADVSSTLGGNISKYKDCHLITPTEKEARMVFDDKKSGLSHIAYKLLESTNAANIVITLGANGVLAFKHQSFEVHDSTELHLESEYIPAMEKKALDPMGAGDSMLAVLALATAAKATLSNAVYLGNMASYLEVNKQGNVPNTRDEMIELIMQRPELT